MVTLVATQRPCLGGQLQGGSFWGIGKCAAVLPTPPNDSRRQSPSRQGMAPLWPMYENDRQKPELEAGALVKLVDCTHRQGCLQGERAHVAWFNYMCRSLEAATCPCAAGAAGTFRCLLIWG
jgi:hypothetical protein